MREGDTGDDTARCIQPSQSKILGRGKIYVKGVTKG